MRKSKSISNWDLTWSVEGAQAWYPDEQVVRFLASHFGQRVGIAGRSIKGRPSGKPLKGIDFGCGPGRHIIAMQDHKISGHGVDISSVAVHQANEYLTSAGWNRTATCSSLTDLPYPDECFDLGICHGVLDHMTADVRRLSISEITRTLKPQAKVLISLISEKDSTFGEGIKIESNTWRVVSGYEEGLPQAFFDEQILKEELINFELLTIVEVVNQTIFGRSLIGTDKHYDTDARFYIVAQKK